MGTNRRLGDRIHRVFVGLVAVALGSFGAVAIAQVEGVTVNPYAIEVTGTAANGGMQTMATYEARAVGSAANSMYYQRGLVAAESTVANGVKSRFAVGPSLLLAGAIVATGYFLDEITHEIQAPGAGDYNPLPTGVTSWCGPSGCGYPDPAAAAKQGHDWSVSNRGWFSAAQVSEWGCGCTGTGAYVYWLVDGSGAFIQTIFVAPGYSPGATKLTSSTDPRAAPVYNATDAPAPATDAQIAAAVAAHPEAWPELFRWPNGSPQVLPEMVPQMAAVQAAYRADNGLAAKPAEVAEPVAAPAPNIGPGVTAQPNTAGSQTAPSAAASASITFPVFCTWASKICTFVDWVKEDADPPDQDLPERSVGVETYASGLGGGSCPPPILMTIRGVPQELPFDNICDLAQRMRAIVLVAAALAAVYILAGS